MEKKNLKLRKRIFKKGKSIITSFLLYLKDFGFFTYENLKSSPAEKYLNLNFWEKIFGGDDGSSKKLKKTTFRSIISRLQKQGIVKKDLQKKVYFLTDKGKEFAGYINDRYSVLKQPWDKKIRIVIFDIPEKKKSYRDWLRQELFLLEFRQLQKSVYIGKFPLPQSLVEEFDDYGLSQHIFIFTAEEIDKKEEIRQLFNEE